MNIRPASGGLVAFAVVLLAACSGGAPEPKQTTASEVPAGTIVFRRFMPGDTLVAGGFGTTFPSAQAPTVEPDVIILPVVAFDRAGMRLGYGRGFYDRAIARQREAGREPKLLGIAFAVQEVTGIPHEPHDVRLDWIVTDKEILDFTGTTTGVGEG